MDPLTLIVMALTAGAAQRLKDTGASAAEEEAYETLKALVRRRFGDRMDAELMLARHAEAPETWETRLAAELTAAGADNDAELLTAAQTLLSLADEPAARAGKYTIDARGAQGLQVGDHNTQDNKYGLGGDHSGD